MFCCIRRQDSNRTNSNLASNINNEDKPNPELVESTSGTVASSGDFSGSRATSTESVASTSQREMSGKNANSLTIEPSKSLQKKGGHSRGPSRFGKPPSAGESVRKNGAMNTDAKTNDPSQTESKTYVSPEDKAAELERMAMDELVEKFNPSEIIQNVPLLASLPRGQRKKLIRGLRRQDFEIDECLMNQGEEGDSFYIIVKGRVEVSTVEAGAVAVLEAGDYAGEQALLKSTPRNATLKAIEKTICLVCNQRTFQSVLQENDAVHFVSREAKRKAVLATFDSSKYENEEIDDKPQEVVEWLLECVQDNLLFLNLDRDQREAVVRCMKLVEVGTDQAIITQGDANADTFYVCDQGSFRVMVEGQGKVLEYHRGGAFGELALLYDNPRAASVIAMEPSTVWEVERGAFRYQLTQTYQRKNAEIVEFLKQVNLFQPLLSRELLLVADALDEVKYDEGTVIFNQGDEGEKFYVIKDGTITWSKDNGESGDLEPLMFFGERALRTNDARAATITCKTQCILFEMGGSHFMDLLGPVLELIDDKIRSYKRAETGPGSPRGEDLDDGKDNSAREQVCDISQLVTIGILGKGAFGTVTLVVDPNTEKSYALKAIKKHQIVELGQQAHIVSEKRVMSMMNCNFLVNLRATYKDPLRVYFLLDACLGGELFTILRQRRYFDEATSRFYTACVVEAFDYMHRRDIIYRDLKPENLVLDSEGYLKVTDFGFAKVVPDKTFTLCGTPDYLAPEIVTGQGHGKAVDWWTLGVLIYEMLASFPPFFDDEPIETYRKIIKGRIKFPRYFSQEARDLIRGLLRSKPMKRLGILKGGAQNIRNHPWFYGFDWAKLHRFELPAPIKNRVRNARDLSNFVNNDDDDDDEEARPIAPEDDFDDEF